jgi:hypothetical protein
MLRFGKISVPFLLIPLLLSSWGYCDSNTEVTQKLVSGRSARTIPHRFTIVPSSVSLMPSQMQHFGVTDAQGNPVIVHWNVSGLHCSGLACGNIDADGNYTPPSSLSQPLEITLEGVVISDPNYSVMTHVQIVPGTAPNPVAVPTSNIQVSSAKPVEPAPIVEKAAIAPGHALPSNQPIAPPPSVSQESARQQIQQPPTPVIAAASQIEAHAPAPNGGLLSLPGAVAAVPTVNTSSNSNHQQMPLPNAVAAAPVVKEKKRNSSDGMILLDLPSSVSNLTAPKKAEPAQSALSSASVGSEGVSTIKRTAGSPVVVPSVTPMPSTSTKPSPLVAVDSRPSASATIDSHRVIASPPASLPIPSAAPSVAATTRPTTIVPAAMPVGALQSHSQPVTIVATPVVSKPEVQAPLVASIAPSTVAKPAAPVPTQSAISASNSAMSANVGGSAGGTGAGVSTVPAGASEHPAAGTMVTYRDGKLTINAENVTLAEVLQLVAKKMGAVIDVPPGSGQERIVEHVGPGYPNDVLTRLLNGSHFNFIIVNSALHPNEPAEVLLSMQGTDTSAPAVAPAAAAAASSVPWTAPDPTLRPLPLPPQYDSSLAPPANKESLTPDALSQLMRDKARELRERAMQQAGSQPDTSQPPAAPPQSTPQEQSAPQQ